MREEFLSLSVSLPSLCWKQLLRFQGNLPMSTLNRMFYGIGSASDFVIGHPTIWRFQNMHIRICQLLLHFGFRQQIELSFGIIIHVSYQL